MEQAPADARAAPLAAKLDHHSAMKMKHIWKCQVPVPVPVPQCQLQLPGASDCAGARGSSRRRQPTAV
eukprot:scaffold27777_cov129-Isochrysis_galbana.AAC.1